MASIKIVVSHEKAVQILNEQIDSGLEIHSSDLEKSCEAFTSNVNRWWELTMFQLKAIDSSGELAKQFRARYTPDLSIKNNFASRRDQGNCEKRVPLSLKKLIDGIDTLKTFLRSIAILADISSEKEQTQTNISPSQPIINMGDGCIVVVGNNNNIAENTVSIEHIFTGLRNIGVPEPDLGQAESICRLPTDEKKVEGERWLNKLQDSIPAWLTNATSNTTALIAANILASSATKLFGLSS
ncbi:MAG: hypothetical protein HKM04_11895 [Legionellales bacterium]|nr:hypothetical protein [Legionellales bacterium]